MFVSEDIFIAIYVDDLLIFGKNTPILVQLQHDLKSRFKMTDLGKISHYLEIEVDMNADKTTVSLHQTTYLRKILSQFNVLDSRPIFTPIDNGIGNIFVPSEDQIDKDTIT